MNPKHPQVPNRFDRPAAQSNSKPFQATQKPSPLVSAFDSRSQHAPSNELDPQTEHPSGTSNVMNTYLIAREMASAKEQVVLLSSQLKLARMQIDELQVNMQFEGASIESLLSLLLLRIRALLQQKKLRTTLLYDALNFLKVSAFFIHFQEIERERLLEENRRLGLEVATLQSNLVEEKIVLLKYKAALSKFFDVLDPDFAQYRKTRSELSASAHL